MVPSFAAATALVAAASSLLGVAALPKVTRTGRYLYTDDGNRFYIKGIGYQEQGESPTLLFVRDVAHHVLRRCRR